MVRCVPLALAGELALSAVELGRGSEVRASIARAYAELGLLDDPDLGGSLRAALVVDSPEQHR
jgi:hypothetical protein